MEYSIVIPFDFSDGSTVALKTAIDLCDRLKAEIHLVHVVPGGIEPAVKRKFETDLQVIVNRHSGFCSMRYAIMEGPVGGSILEYVNQHSNPVLFLSRSSTDGKYNQIGSISHYIMASAPCPVLFLKNPLDFNKINTILVPVDLNLENKLKLGYAMFLSRFFGNALVRLLCVVYDYDDFRLNKLMFRLNHLITFFEKMGVSSVGEIIRCSSDDGGEAYSKEAVEYADKSEAELILLMTNDEKAGQSEGISRDADYMLSHFRNNVLSITPFVKV